MNTRPFVFFAAPKVAALVPLAALQRGDNLRPVPTKRMALARWLWEHAPDPVVAINGTEGRDDA